MGACYRLLLPRAQAAFNAVGACLLLLLKMGAADVATVHKSSLTFRAK